MTDVRASPTQSAYDEGVLLDQRRPTTETDRSVAFFRLGFRPFFLLGGAFAALAIPLWLLVWGGRVTLPTTALPASWHAHEMVFGFVVAIVAGFLLTAVRNWTSRPTPTGPSLAGLAALWAAARLFVAFDGTIPHGLVAAVDCAFLPALALAIARPIVASKNWRNLAFVPLLLSLFAANVAYHFGSGTVAVRAPRIAIDVILVIVVVIGGRVIPSFTANGLRIEVPSRKLLDRAALVSMGAVALLGAVFDGSWALAIASIVAGVLHGARLLGWRSWATRRSPILWVLHVGYAWIAIGLVLRGVATFVPSLPASAPTHALTVGAIGTLILGMMSRVSLGHTGRMLTVARPITFAYALVALAALVRAGGPIVVPNGYVWVLVVAGALWTMAFGTFVAVYFPVLVSPRVDGKPG